VLRVHVLLRRRGVGKGGRREGRREEVREGGGGGRGEFIQNLQTHEAIPYEVGPMQGEPGEEKSFLLGQGDEEGCDVYSFKQDSREALRERRSVESTHTHAHARTQRTIPHK
jgi:hypothetical protein